MTEKKIFCTETLQNSASEKAKTSCTEKDLFVQFPELSVVERKTDSYRKVNSFVLRAQKLRKIQIDAVKENLHNYTVFFKEELLDFQALFGNNNPVVVEIGFGMGEEFFQMARDNPSVNYFGLEVFLYGFTKLLAKISSSGLTNIKIMRFNAHDFLNFMVPDCSVSGFHIFFPDPWQKKRHNKRRLIKEDFVLLLKKKLKPNGYVYCTTDWEEYAYQMVSVFSQADFFNKYGSFAPRKQWRPKTKYEEKALKEGRKIYEIFFIKL